MGQPALRLAYQNLLQDPDSGFSVTGSLLCSIGPEPVLRIFTNSTLQFLFFISFYALEAD